MPDSQTGQPGVAGRKQIEQCEKKDLDMIRDCFGILQLLEGKENLPELTKETVKQLVSAIYVYGSDRVEIVFKFKDEMDELTKLKNLTYGSV